MFTPETTLGWVGVAVAVGIVGLSAVRMITEGGSTPKGKSVEETLEALRNASCDRVVAKIVRVLKQQARNGRSDYEFSFRPWDMWLEWYTVLGIFSIPYYTTSYWDCIDSDGSREVIRDKIKGGDKQLYVQWSIHSDYPKGNTPKWVLLVKWEGKGTRY